MRTTWIAGMIFSLLAGMALAQDEEAKDPDPKEVEGLIEQLGSEEFSTREEAQTKLEGFGKAILDQLKKAIEGEEDVERRDRIQSILDKLEPKKEEPRPKPEGFEQDGRRVTRSFRITRSSSRDGGSNEQFQVTRDGPRYNPKLARAKVDELFELIKTVMADKSLTDEERAKQLRELANDFEDAARDYQRALRYAARLAEQKKAEKKEEKIPTGEEKKKGDKPKVEEY